MRFSRLLGGRKHGSKYRVELRGKVRQIGEVLQRDHKKVCRRLRGYVSNDKTVIVTREDVAGHLAVANLTEDTVFGHRRVSLARHRNGFDLD